MNRQPGPAPTPPLWARTDDLGQLFDRTIQVYRRNFILFAAISIVLALPDVIIDLFGPSLATSALRFISAPYILAAYYLAATHVVFHGPIGPLAILQRAFRRYPSFAGVLAGYLGAALTLSNGALGTWLIVVIGGSGACLMAAESLNPLQTWRRREQLGKGNLARRLLASLAIAIFGAVPIFVLLVPAAIAVHAVPGFPNAISMVVGILATTLTDCLATPLVPIGWCLLYVHMRVRNEGLELDDLATSAGNAA